MANNVLPWISGRVPYEIEEGVSGYGEEPPDYWLTFLQARFEANNYFAQWRAGRRPRLDDRRPWTLEFAQQNPEFAMLPTTSFRRWQGPWENIYLPVAPGFEAQAPVQEPIDPDAAIPGNRAATLQEIGGAMARQVRSYFTDNAKVDVRIRKILGAGGAGVALLCDAASADPATRAKKFVLKVDQHADTEAGNPQTQRERACHRVCMLCSWKTDV